jgi:diguanylate cyclase (GGDEF)-like protein
VAELFETLENLSEGYVTLDEELRFTFVNRQAEHILGMSRDRIVGRTVEEVFAEAHESFTARYRAVLATGTTDEFESYYPPHDAWYRIRVLRSAHGLTLSFRNATEERRALTHDHLTGLPNRAALVAWLDESLCVPNPQVIVCLLDLDRFRYLNDGIGHSFGDELLVAMARRLEGLLSEHDGVIARTGGDEFVLAVRNCTAESGAAFVHSILPAVREPIEFGGRRLIITTSMGLAHTGDLGPWTSESFLRNADAALYNAKEAGGDRIASTDPSMRERALHRLELESDLRVAIDGDQLRLVYQPSFDLATGRPTGVEALVRWHHPERGVISPADFIPMAEETGLIIRLGSKVLDIVAAEMRARPRPPIPFTVWVNASIQQLRDPQFFQRIVDDPTFHGGRLGIELTETMFLEDVAPAADGLARLADLGVKIAIDDFGTGYSSLARLPRYPFNLLKIDQSFTQNVDRAEFLAIVAASIQLGHGLQKRVIAEGVETREQLFALRRLGCDEVSGYLLARPVPVDELSSAIAKGTAELASGDAGSN